MMFFMLFPYGVGHWLGPTGHPTPLTFEQYATHRLCSVDRQRFIEEPNWLTWALTQSDDREFAATINCVLAVHHGLKARHLGKGDLEILTLVKDFKLKKLEGEVLVEA